MKWRAAGRIVDPAALGIFARQPLNPKPIDSMPGSGDVGTLAPHAGEAIEVLNVQARDCGG